MKKLLLNQILTITLLLLAPALAWGHGEAHGKKDPNRKISTEEHPFGREGDPKKATRTINVDMSDKMRFTPAAIT
ncbi:MAG: plastocyanin, partial [Betaproteobacteria bacterium]|nr:plastocyanin [Betaproteobacteria bacterium]